MYTCQDCIYESKGYCTYQGLVNSRRIEDMGDICKYFDDVFTIKNIE